ncbi:hypothetical protein BTH42_15290 [Burkholderia sp. SRS-W-2-2016]|nr:hypothetical protein BTH42_15290 [Burkholderia sp. SRS-W-2-2016]
MSCAARYSETTSLNFILNPFKFFFTGYVEKNRTVTALRHSSLVNEVSTTYTFSLTLHKPRRTHHGNYAVPPVRFAAAFVQHRIANQCSRTLCRCRRVAVCVAACVAHRVAIARAVPAPSQRHKTAAVCAPTLRHEKPTGHDVFASRRISSTTRDTSFRSTRVRRCYMFEPRRHTSNCTLCCKRIGQFVRARRSLIPPFVCPATRPISLPRRR